MAERDLELTAGVVHRLPELKLERQNQPDVQSPGALQRDPVEGVTCRAGDKSCATAHASALNLAPAVQPARVERSVLQLQRQYGNRYVERVLKLARAVSEHANARADVERTIEQQRGGGQPLDAGVRRQMEPALGADFSGVRVHTDAQAHSLNRSLSARAFTTGRDIFFRQGAYDPGSSIGRELLAHELTHVVQQNGPAISRKLSVSQPGDPHEVEAEHTARAIIQQEHQTTSSPTDAVARQDEKEDGPTAMASRATAEVQRQPEAPKDDEEKKKRGLMAKRDESFSLARQAEESPEQTEQT